MNYLDKLINFIMKILVTGGYGFIGSNFINRIVNNSEVKSIVNVDSCTYAANEDNINIDSILNYKLTNIKADINDTHLIESLLYVNKITHVVHFAAESHVDNSISNPDKFIKTQSWLIKFFKRCSENFAWLRTCNIQILFSINIS